jgi:hypothetical protein
VKCAMCDLYGALIHVLSMLGPIGDVRSYYPIARVARF